MNRKIAGFSFVGACIIIAILMLTQVVTPIVGGIIFAVALAASGVSSNGFRKV
jgi:ABC-type sulfate transport system permease subunit